MKKRIISLILILSCVFSLNLTVNADKKPTSVLIFNGGENVSYQYDDLCNMTTLTFTGTGYMYDIIDFFEVEEVQTNLGDVLLQYLVNLPWYKEGGYETLRKVTIENGIKSLLDYAFMDCQSLEEVIIPEGFDMFGLQAFSNSGIKNIEIPDSVEYINGAFLECRELESIKLPNNNKVEIEGFNGCTKLEQITIPDKVTKIGTRAFIGCTSLRQVQIPVSVTNIGFSPFEGCTSLTDIYYGGTESQWDAVYTNVNGNLANVTVHFNSTNMPQLTPAPATPTPTPTPSVSPSPSPSPTPSASPSPSPTPTPSASPSPTPTPTPSASPSPTPSASPSPTPTPSASPSPTPTPSASPSPSPTPTPSSSPSPTPSLTSTNLQVNVAAAVTGNKAVFTARALDADRADELSGLNLYVAEYDENGRLIRVCIGTKSAVSDGAINIEADLPSSQKYKFLLWDQNQYPLINPIPDINAAINK